MKFITFLFLMGLAVCFSSGYLFYHDYIEVNEEKKTQMLEYACSRDTILFNHNIANNHCSENPEAKECDVKTRLFNYGILNEVCEVGS